MKDCTAGIIHTLGQCLSSAIEDLPLSPVDVAFNGADWVWLWRWRSEDQSSFVETSVHVHPDPYECDGFEVQILGSAWNPEQPGASAGRMYYARYFETFPTGDKRQGFVSELRDQLKAANFGAIALARELPDIQTARSEAYEALQELALQNGKDQKQRFE